MIRLRMTLADLRQMRFAYSPLTEVAESLYMLSSRCLRPLHRDWFESVRGSLGAVDMQLLLAVVPAGPNIANFLFGGAVDPQTTIGQQLRHVAGLPSDRLEEDLREVWAGRQMPSQLEGLLRDGGAGARRLADAIGNYWDVAIEPHWKKMRAILDDDVAFRAGQLTTSGMSSMLCDLHPQVAVEGSVLTIDKRSVDSDTDLKMAGLRLVPSIFVWPDVIFASTAGCPAVLTYPARGVGNLSGTQAETPLDELGSLLGRSRAAILGKLAGPYSTTELAVLLNQSPPAVSQHLAVLRRSGLVVSRRKGRSVLYQQTDLGASVVAAASMSTRSAGIS
ncbi:ArsR/SmtB family transcription factor [Kribbella swartbergensis]